VCTVKRLLFDTLHCAHEHQIVMAIHLDSFEFLLDASYMPGDLLCRVQYLFCITVFTIRNSESTIHNPLGCSK